MKRFENKVVVVTGASRGIGQAICIAFAREGALVAGVARSDLADTGAKVTAAGGAFLAVKADLATGTQSEAAGLIAGILAHFLGEPQQSRHLFLHNEEVALSPNWSMHFGCGTSNYKFIWGMAGENQVFDDMDPAKPLDLR